MSQSKQIKAKTLINFCGGDFLKFSKHRIFDKKQGKKILDKTNSFTNSNCYNDKDTKAETTVDEDKDRLIVKLNQRIVELESRIQLLESNSVKSSKESMIQTPKASKYLTGSNSLISFCNGKRNEAIGRKGLTQSNNTPPNKSLQDKCFDRLKIHQLLNVKPFKKQTIKSQSVKLSIRKLNANNNFVSPILHTQQTIEPKCKEVIQTYNKKDNSIKLKREQSLDNIEGKTKLNVYINNKILMSNSPCSKSGSVNSNIKTIPKIPRKRNDLSKSNTMMTYSNSINVTSIKDQLNEIRIRTKNVINELIDISYLKETNNNTQADN